jgi:hypothetical protein
MTSSQITASLMALTGLARTPLLAGLAANFCFSLVNGLMPSRAGRAGFLTTTNLAKPCLPVEAPSLMARGEANAAMLARGARVF